MSSPEATKEKLIAEIWNALEAAGFEFVASNYTTGGGRELSEICWRKAGHKITTTIKVDKP